MRNFIYSFFLVFSMSLVAQTNFDTRLNLTQVEQAPAKLIPYPKQVKWGNEKVFFKALKISSSKHKIPEAIQSEWGRILSEFSIPEGQKALPVFFTSNKKLEKEAYQLKINSKKIEIIAKGQAGWFYGLQTLRQLISTENKGFNIQQVQIFDSPDFPIRGFLLDVGRNFQTIDFLKQQLDLLAKYKMNVFQWHLTDYPAWRVESKIHPELTAAKFHRETRDPGKFYTFNQVRELFKYAKDRNIQIIPEIDMPGHSTYFKDATGFSMDSEEGKKILKETLDEFFEEIPYEMSPYIHLGSDEVEIENPKEFMDEMTGFVRKYKRQPLAWVPGLPTDEKVIAQIWKPGFETEPQRQIIDSWNSYINNSEPLTQMAKILLKPIGKDSKSKVLGGILCLWHDVNLEENEKIIDFHAYYPAILTYAWRAWSADVTKTDKKYITTFPSLDDGKAYQYASIFEDYLLHHKEQFFRNKNFNYAQQRHMVWQLNGPFKKENNQLIPTDSTAVKTAIGGTIIIKDRFKEGGYFPKAKVGEVYVAKTMVYSPKEQTLPAWVGFETALRANRIYQGLPADGEWDSSGGTVSINEEKIPAPQWEKPEFRLSTQEGWGNTEDKEIPWSREEFYWTRPPVEIHLKKGWNTIEVTSPGTNDYQNWMFTFIFLDAPDLIFATGRTR